MLIRYRIRLLLRGLLGSVGLRILAVNGYMISLIPIRLVETEYDNPTQLQMYLYVKPTASKTPGALRFNFHITSINLVQDFALYG